MIDCEDMIRKALNSSGLSDEKFGQLVDEAIREMQKLKRKADAHARASGMNPDLDALTKQKVSRDLLEAYAKKRNTMLQLNVRADLLNYCQTHFKGMEAEGIYARMAGSKYARAGARESVDAMGRGLEGRYLAGLAHDLETLGHGELKILTKGTMDADICDALWNIKDRSKFKGPEKAWNIAEVIHKWNEQARINENHAGAWINELPGFIVSQSHDQGKLRRHGREQWIADVKDKIDWERTLGGEIDPVAEPERAMEFLRNVYNSLETGHHMRTGGDNANALARTSVIGETASKDSHSRVLHFKSGREWFAYHQKYGRGTLSEAVVEGLSHSAKSTALMTHFGPSPHATLEWVIKALKDNLLKDGSNPDVRAVKKMETKLRNQMKILDGSENMEGNPNAAAVWRYVRGIEAMSKLGGAVLSAMADVPAFASEFAYQGRNFFGAMAEGLMTVIQGYGSAESRNVASQCGVFFDAMIGGLSARFAGDGMHGKMAAAMNVFFKLSGLTYWTDLWKRAAVLMMSHDLAQVKGSTWQQLNPARQRVLGLYGIDAERWDLMRKQVSVMADGREYLTPEMAKQISREDLAALVKKQGREVSDGSIGALRDEIENQFRSYFRDRVQYAVLEPDAANKRLLHQGTAAGTLPGELLRLATQFKAFPTGFIQRTMSREIYGRGADKVWGRNGGLAQEFSLASNASGERGNFFKLFVMMTAFGYLAMQAKAIAAGKTPREWSWKTALAAMTQGGGLGFYGDFLFAERSRTGSGPLPSIAGPIAGDLDSLISTIYKARDKALVGDDEWKDVGMDLIKWGVSHVPGNNLFYARVAIDMGLTHAFYERMRPGYFERYCRRILRENGQRFLWK